MTLAQQCMSAMPSLRFGTAVYISIMTINVSVILLPGKWDVFWWEYSFKTSKKNQKCPLKVTWAKVSLGQRHCGACKWQAWKQKQSKFAPRGRPGCPKCPSSLFVDRLAGQSHLAIPFSKKNLLHLYPLPERCNAGQASTLVWVFIRKR